MVHLNQKGHLFILIFDFPTRSPLAVYCEEYISAHGPFRWRNIEAVHYPSLDDRHRQGPLSFSFALLEDMHAFRCQGSTTLTHSSSNKSTDDNESVCSLCQSAWYNGHDRCYAPNLTDGHEDRSPLVFVVVGLIGMQIDLLRIFKIEGKKLFIVQYWRFLQPLKLNITVVESSFHIVLNKSHDRDHSYQIVSMTEENFVNRD